MKGIKKGKNQSVVRWTDREVDYLRKHIGYIPLEDIAYTLNRTVAAIESKLTKTGISIQSIQMDKNNVSLNQLTKILHVDFKVLKRWIEKYDFPVVKLKFKKASRYGFYVPVDHFWVWAEKHSSLINWHKLERLTLLPEPLWLEDKLREPQKIIKRVWTKKEDVIVWSLYYHQKLKIKDIAIKQNRTEKSIERRLKYLRDNDFAKEMDCHEPKPIVVEPILKRWTFDEEELLIELFYLQNFSCEDVAFLLDRTVNAIERKLNKLRNIGRVTTELLDDNPNKKWTEEELSRLKKLRFVEKYTASQIAIFFPARTKSAIDNKIRELIKK